MTQRTLEVWRYGGAHSYCNFLLRKHDIKIRGCVQAWLHAFLNWRLVILTPENDAGRCLCLESGPIRLFPTPSSVQFRLAGSLSAAMSPPSETVPVPLCKQLTAKFSPSKLPNAEPIQCHDTFGNTATVDTDLPCTLATLNIFLMTNSKLEARSRKL
jgi:hypothetical protein